MAQSPGEKPSILVQLDPDPQPSAFDGVVAVDAGVDHLFRHAGVQPEQVRDLVFGTIFTRGVDELNRTAIFVGGSRVADGEALLVQVLASFFGPMRVSVMMDANGANTTAAAAVISASRHLTLSGSSALVLAGTGPVGQRAARLLSAAGATVRVGSRDERRAASVCETIAADLGSAVLEPWAIDSTDAAARALDGVELVVAAGAAGVELLAESVWHEASTLRVAIDLNAVPPLGIAGLEVTDKAVERHGAVCYGAIGVGGTKMKIHKAAVRQLFTQNDLVLDVDSIYQLGQHLEDNGNG